MTSKTSITYGGALYDLAKDEGLSAQILADLGAFAAVFRENPDYRRLLTEPSIPKAEREALLDEAWKDALQCSAHTRGGHECVGHIYQRQMHRRSVFGHQFGAQQAILLAYAATHRHAVHGMVQLLFRHRYEKLHRGGTVGRCRCPHGPYGIGESGTH